MPEERRCQFGEQKMDRFDHAFAALSRKMGRLPLPEHAVPAPLPISSLIERVNAARRES